jgi:peptidoglycan-associated lipoprotein
VSKPTQSGLEILLTHEYDWYLKKEEKMKRKWIILAMVLIVPAMLFSVSCAKKSVMTEPAVDTTAEDAARQAELEKQQEMERQKQLEEERLAAERATQLKAEAEEREQMLAKNRFLNENIYFAFDDSTLDDQAQELLKQKAVWLQDNADASIVVEGHCDERGTNAYNLALGERRAESVKVFLVNLGISDSRLTTISYGEEKPVDMGHNEEAWAKNRRAAFVLE